MEVSQSGYDAAFKENPILAPLGAGVERLTNLLIDFFEKNIDITFGVVVLILISLSFYYGRRRGLAAVEPKNKELEQLAKNFRKAARQMERKAMKAEAELKAFQKHQKLSGNREVTE